MPSRFSPLVFPLLTLLLLPPLLLSLPLPKCLRAPHQPTLGVEEAAKLEGPNVARFSEPDCVNPQPDDLRLDLGKGGLDQQLQKLGRCIAVFGEALSQSSSDLALLVEVPSAVDLVDGLQEGLSAVGASEFPSSDARPARVQVVVATP